MLRNGKQVKNIVAFTPFRGNENVKRKKCISTNRNDDTAAFDETFRAMRILNSFAVKLEIKPICRPNYH